MSSSRWKRREEVASGPAGAPTTTAVMQVVGKVSAPSHPLLPSHARSRK